MASGSTGNYSIPYPIPTDPVNVTGDMEALATRIDFILQEEIEDTAAAMWTGGTFSNGIVTPTYNDTTGKMSMTLTQDIQTSASPTFSSLNITNNILPVSDNTGVVGTSSKTWSNGQFTALTVDGTLSVRTAIDLADSDILQFGTSDDVKIFYNGSNNILDIELESAAVSLNVTDNGTDKVVITKSNGNISTVGQLISTIATGTAPLSVSSSTIVSNLNSDLLDGQHGSYYLDWTNTTNKPDPSITLLGDVSGSATFTNLTSASVTVVVSNDSHSHTGTTISNLDASDITSGTLPVTRGGTGVTTSTGSTNVVLSNSPTLTGVPIAPTASVDTNTTQIATTAFVINQGYLKSSTASTTYAPINSPTFTGTVTVPGITSTGDLLPSSDNSGVVGNASFTWNNGQFTNLTVDSTLTVRAAIDLADSDVIRFGSSDDVKLFYDGSNNDFEIELESAADSVRITDNGTDSVIFNKTGDISTRGDEIIVLSGQASGSSNFNITVDRGSDPDVALRWNESGGSWQFTNDGTNYVDIGSGGSGGVGLDSVLFLAGM